MGPQRMQQPEDRTKNSRKNTAPEPVNGKKLHQARHQMQQNAQPQRMHQHGTSRKTAVAAADAPARHQMQQNAQPQRMHQHGTSRKTAVAAADAAEREKATAQQNGPRTRGKHRYIAICPQRETAYKASHRRQEDIKKSATNGGKKIKKEPARKNPDRLQYHSFFTHSKITSTGNSRIRTA